MKKLSVVIVCISLILVCGCVETREVFRNTSRGTVAVAGGVGRGFLYGVVGIGKVLLEVPKTIWEGTKKIDEWIKETFW